MKKALVVILMLSLVIAGCRRQNSGADFTDGANESGETDAASADLGKTETDMFTQRDMKTEYSENDSILIQLNGISATASSDSVKIFDSMVTITEEGTYVISGTLSDGMIIVNAADTAKIQIVLNGVDVTSKTSAAIYVLEADKVFVTVAEGTENVLVNGGSFEAIDENNIDAVVFSKQDITFNGSGSLTVISPAGHGIVCKDDLVFTGGFYTLSSASHGVDANDSVRITGTANLVIDAGKDGIHCENTEDASLGFVYITNGVLQIEAEGDGIAASSYMQIESGTFNLLIGGGSVNGSKASSGGFGGFMGGGPGRVPPGNTTTTDENGISMKGIKASNSILINGGNFEINSADDAVHSDVSVTINGGVFTIASGDDAFHADETLRVTAGTINVTESYEGLEALNIDIGGGDIALISSDDGLNAAGGMDASGMTGGRDGMFGVPGGMGGRGPGGMGGGISSSSNGSIVISGGKIYVKASGDGLDANGTLTISGGTFIGTGAAGMAQSFSDSEQGVVAVGVGNQAAGTEIVLKDNNGNIIISYAPELSFAVVILSSPEIVTGETYTITVGTASGEFEAR